MVDISILKAAADRVSAWEEKYSVFGGWQVDRIGLVLRAETGGEFIEKSVSWLDLELARYPTNLLEHTEKAALAGLSS